MKLETSADTPENTEWKKRKTYETKTVLYLCSVQITHKSGIWASLLHSAPFSAVPFGPAGTKHQGISDKSRCSTYNHKQSYFESIPSAFCCAAAAKTLHVHKIQ